MPGNICILTSSVRGEVDLRRAPEKRHKDVMAIMREVMEELGEELGQNFRPSSYTDANGQQRPPLAAVKDLSPSHL